MAGRSPTQSTLRKLKKEGWLAKVTEHWNPWAKIRQDLWGFCDVLACKPGVGWLAVQATSRPNISARVKKIQANDMYPIVKSTPNTAVEVWGWFKDGNRWDVRIVEL